MEYELVWVKTRDNLELYGLLKESSTKKKILVNIHGTASNFYEEDFIGNFAKDLPSIGVSVLSTNNRGAYGYDAYQKSGAATERFEDCLIDIDCWIEFAIKRGYKEIVLSGHSLGTEKVVYYMRNGKYAKKIRAILLLAPADSYGTHKLQDGKDNTFFRKKTEKYLEISKKLIAEGKGETILGLDVYGSHDGIIPKTANSFVDFLGEDSKVREALPFYERRLKEYSKIKIPIFVAIGDGPEYTAITNKEALELMKKENSLTETHLIKGADHDFIGGEEELTRLVKEFLAND